MTAITGASTLGYATTVADKGYMMIKATGNNTTIGGYI